MRALVRRPRVRVAILALGMPLVIAGCSVTTDGVGTGLRSPVVSPSNQSLNALVVQPADLPVGWSAAGPTEDINQSDIVDPPFAACTGGRDTTSDLVGNATSPTYSRGTSKILSDVSSMANQADVQADESTLTSTNAAYCFGVGVRAGMVASVGSQGAVGQPSATAQPGSELVASNVFAIITVRIPATVGQTTVIGYVEAAFMTGPGLEADVMFTSLGEPLPTDVTSSVIRKVALRIAHA
jgi:hypothetical protein